MKKYLKVTITTKEGRVFENLLKLSEAHLLSKIAQDNKYALVECINVSAEEFKSIFG